MIDHGDRVYRTFWIVTGEVSVAAVGMWENKCLATPLLPVISTVLNGKIRSHPEFPCAASSLTLPQKRMPFANDI